MTLPSSRLPKHTSDLVHGSPAHSPTLMKRLLHKYSHSAPRSSPPPRLLLVLLLSAQILFLAIVRLGPSSPIWSSKASTPAQPSVPVAFPSSLSVGSSVQEDAAASLETAASDADDLVSAGTTPSSDDNLETSSATGVAHEVSKEEESVNLVIGKEERPPIPEEELLQQSSSADAGLENPDAPSTKKSASKDEKKKNSKKKKKKSQSDPPKEIVRDVSLLNEQSDETQSNGTFIEKTEEMSSVSDEKVVEGAGESAEKINAASDDLLLSTEDKGIAESTNDNAILESLEEKKDDKKGVSSDPSSSVEENTVQDETVREVENFDSGVKQEEWKESSNVSLTERQKEKAEEGKQEETTVGGSGDEKKHESDSVQNEVGSVEDAVPETQSLEEKSLDANAQTEVLAAENPIVEENAPNAETQSLEEKSLDANAQTEVLVAENPIVEENAPTAEDRDRTVEGSEVQDATVENQSEEEKKTDVQAEDQSISKESQGLIVQKVNEETSSSSECANGQFYVYDLPQIFNHDITANCTALNPWVDVCPNLQNGGLGVSLEDASPLGQTGSWFVTNQFTAEVVFHNRILQHPCLTDKQEIAAGFYVPFYAGLDVGRYLWSGSTVEQRDQLSNQVLEWLVQQEPWKKNGGRDHFMMIGRITWDFRRSKDEGWGSGFFHHPAMQNTTRLVIERNPWDDIEMAVPYLTNFHPQSDADLRAWQNHIRNYKRSTLFSFAGAPRQRFPDDFRAILFEQCQQADQCRSLDCSNRTCEDNQKTLQLFMDSTFCLQPRGDSFTRRSTFDCLLAGSIPVFFWRRSAYLQYKWHLPADESSYSVFISKNDLRNGTRIEEVLKSLPPEKVTSMQEAVIQMVPRIVYAVSGFSLKEEKDAFDVAIDGVMRSFRGYLR